MAFKKKGTIQGDQFKVTGVATTINSQSVTVTERNSAGEVTRCSGTVTITDAGAGYAKGCEYIKTDGSIGSIIYRNEGTSSSCDFNVVETGASTVTAVVAGDGLSGGGTEGSVTLTVNTDASTIETNADALRVKDAGITPAKQSTAARTRVAVIPFKLPAPTGSNQGPLSVANFSVGQAMTVVSVKIGSDIATTGSNGTDNYTFMPKNQTGAANLHTSPATTNGGELATNALKTVTVSQNLSFTANQVFGLDVNITDGAGAGPTSLANAQLYVVLEYTI